MTNFNEYIDDEHRERQLKIIDKITINDDMKNLITDKKIELLVFAQAYCPDCQAIVGILENIAMLDPNLDITYKPRTGNEQELEKYNKDKRIPTVILNGKTIISEFPDFVKDLMQYGDYEEIKYNFRTGNYNKEIIEEIILKLFA